MPDRRPAARSAVDRESRAAGERRNGRVRSARSRRRARASRAAEASSVGGAEDESGAAAVGGVDRAGDAGVVDDRDQVTDPVSVVQPSRSRVRRGRCTSTPRAGAGSASVRRSCRRKAAARPDRPARCRSAPRRSGRESPTSAQVGTEHLERRRRRSPPMVRRGAALGGPSAMLLGEVDEVERQAGFDEVGGRRTLTADLGDLVRPVSGERGNRDESGLEAGVPRHHRSNRLVTWKQHPVARLRDRARADLHRSGRSARRARRTSDVPCSATTAIPSGCRCATAVNSAAMGAPPTARLPGSARPAPAGTAAQARP